jgi:hypothetical protein
MTPKELFRDEIESLHYKSKWGCGNAGCSLVKPVGQHTNGGCTCSPRKIAKRLLDLAIELEKLDCTWMEIKP